MIAQIVVILSFLNFVNAIPINNGIDGEPEISCGPTAIGVLFRTTNPFEGRVYVKGRHTEEACIRTFNDGVSKEADLVLNFEGCGVRRERSLNPAGVFVSVTVVISFHPKFITKVDRSITLQCFYMEADKTVSEDVEVSMITTDFRTLNVPMPVCRYEILDGAPDAAPLQFAFIGQKAYHKWTCDSDTVDTFCMTVHSCFVNDDEDGDKTNVLDENGCAVDRYVMGNLEYLTDMMAGVETHVFKYPDKSGLYFDCQVRIDVKEPNGVCQRAQCSEPRIKRSAWSARNPKGDKCWGSCLDLSTDRLNVFDVTTKEQENSFLNHDRFIEDAENIEEITREPICLTTLEISGIFGALTVSCVILTFFMFFAIKHKEVRLVLLKSRASYSES